MYAANAEKLQSNEPAKVKGPAFKQASEEVEAIWKVFSSWDSDERKASARSDDAVALAAKAELVPALARTEQLNPRIKVMTDKANEPDPDLQTYGPVMKGKVLALGEEFRKLEAKGVELLAAYSETVEVASQRSIAQDARRTEEEAAARRREEEAAAAREREEAEAKEAQKRAAEAAKAKEEEAQREREAELTAKMEAAEERNRRAALAMAKGHEIAEEPQSRWVTDPIGEGGEELTLEMAMELADQSQKRLQALTEAGARVLASNSPQQAQAAAHTLIIYLRNILREPRSREVRRIPADNQHFLTTVGNVTGGKEIMLALGFEEEEEADAGAGSAPRTFFVLNRVYLDDLRAAMGILEGGARR